MVQLPRQSSAADTPKLTLPSNPTNGIPQRSPDPARTLTFTGPNAHRTLPRNSRESAPTLTVEAFFSQKSGPFRALNLESEELENLNHER
jgi:hypothetical protein